jgi:UDPglucose 6-dehydrogenase
LHEVDLISQRRRTRVVQVAAELLDRPYGPAGARTGCRIAVLGATFKPGTDDVLTRRPPIPETRRAGRR